MCSGSQTSFQSLGHPYRHGNYRSLQQEHRQPIRTGILNVVGGYCEAAKTWGPGTRKSKAGQGANDYIRNSTGELGAFFQVIPKTGSKCEAKAPREGRAGWALVGARLVLTGTQSTSTGGYEITSTLSGVPATRIESTGTTQKQSEGVDCQHPDDLGFQGR